MPVYEDLEPIANLKYVDAAEAGAKKMHQRLVEMQAKYRGHGISGRFELTKVNIRLEAVKQECRSLYDIWLDLIFRRNGKITRPDVKFVMSKVETCASKFAGIARIPTVGNILSVQYVSEVCEERRRVAISTMQKELAIRIGEQEAFPEKVEMAQQQPIQVHIQNSTVANLNLGSQVGRINTALATITNEDHAEIAEALKQITEAIAGSAALAESTKKEAIEAISTLAVQAEAKPEEQSTGTVKAILSWLPTAISTAADLATLWNTLGPLIAAHFRI
jgi:hypothetical protein